MSNQTLTISRLQADAASGKVVVQAVINRLQSDSELLTQLRTQIASLNADGDDAAALEQIANDFEQAQQTLSNALATAAETNATPENPDGSLPAATLAGQTTPLHLTDSQTFQVTTVAPFGSVASDSSSGTAADDGQDAGALAQDGTGDGPSEGADASDTAA